MTCTWAGLPYPTPKDQVGGHEGVGKIVKMGPGNEKANVKVGDRVGIKWLAYCCGGCRTSTITFTGRRNFADGINSGMLDRPRWRMFQPADIRILQARDFPTIRDRPGALCYSNS